MAAGDRFQLLDHQIWASVEPVLNVYHYVQNAGTQGSEALALAFALQVMPALVDLQSNAIVHDRIEVINLDDPTDFWTEGLSANNVGERTEEGLPPYNAYAFRYNRATRAVRNGQKRIAGIVETFQNNGIITGATVPPLLTAVAAAMEADLNALPDPDTWTPVIMRREGTDPVIYTHFPLASVEYVRITSQVSRKRYNI